MNACAIEQEANSVWVREKAMASAYVQAECPPKIAVIYREALHKLIEQDAPTGNAGKLDQAELRRLYVFDGAQKIESFLVDHRALSGLLLEAAPHLQEAFGADTPLRLSVWNDEEDGSQSLRAVAVWAGPVLEARYALRQFDETWWFQNCHRGSGNLILDYELV
jgi:hypothetical protein